MRRFPTRMVVANLALLAGAFALQVAFLGPGGHSSLSDLPRVFLHPGALPYVDRVLEYPVGSGILLYLATLVAPTPLGVLTTTAIAAGTLSVTVTIVLERRCGPRAWRWALGTPVLLFAFQNWDTFAIAATLAALLAYEQRRLRLAGAALAVGAAIKLFPVVVGVPLVADCWARGDRRGARRLATTTVVGVAVLNLPFIVANRAGWWWPFAFQGQRNATWGSAWLWLYRAGDLPTHGAAGARLANAVSLTALVVGLAVLTTITVRTRIEPMAAAAATVVIFILANKVYSPTYDVWLVIFFVLLPITRRLWLAFCTVDLAICATVYGHFHGVGSSAFVHTVLPWLVLTRTVVLASVLVALLHSPWSVRRAVADSIPCRPEANVPRVGVPLPAPAGGLHD
jgi:uncharacterized membrane protein